MHDFLLYFTWMYLFFKFIHICKPKHVSVELFHNKIWTRFEYDDPTSLRQGDSRFFKWRLWVTNGYTL